MRVGDGARTRFLPLLLAIAALTAHVCAHSFSADVSSVHDYLAKRDCGGLRRPCCEGDTCSDPGLTCRVFRCRRCGGKLDPACEYPGTIPCDKGFTPIDGACFTDTYGAGRGERNPYLAEDVDALPPVEVPVAAAPEDAALAHHPWLFE